MKSGTIEERYQSNFLKEKMAKSIDVQTFDGETYRLDWEIARHSQTILTKLKNRGKFVNNTLTFLLIM